MFPILPGKTLQAETAVEVVAVNPLGSKIGIDPSPVGCRRRRGIASLAVAVVVHGSRVCRSFPEDLPAVAIEANHFQSMAAICTHAVRML